MILKVTTDIEEIRSILCHPEIYDVISEDGSETAEEYIPPFDDGNYYIGGYVDNKIMAVMNYHNYLDGNECHVQVLPEFRKEYAKKFGEQSLEFRGTRPLYAEIPTLYKNVLDFALINNFKIIGTIENDYTKNGKTYDIKVLRFENGKD